MWFDEDDNGDGNDGLVKDDGDGVADGDDGDDKDDVYLEASLDWNDLKKWGGGAAGSVIGRYGY